METIRYDRLIHYFCDFAVKHKKEFKLLDREKLNIDRALTLAAENGYYSELINTAAALYPFWQSRGSLDVARKHLEAAAQHEDRVTVPQRCTLYLSLIRLEQSAGTLERAEHFIQKGLEALNLQSEPTLESHLLSLRGQIAHSHGNTIQARTYWQQALEIAEKEDNKERIGVITKNLGALEDEQGNTEVARRYFCKGLAAAKVAKLDELKGEIYLNLSAHNIDQQNYKRAQRYLEKGLSIANAVGNVRMVADFLFNMGHFELDQSSVEADSKVSVVKVERSHTEELLEPTHLQLAERYFEAALPKGEESQDTELIAYNHAGLAEVKIKMEKFREAGSELDLALHYAKKIGSESLIEMIDEIRQALEKARTTKHD